MVNLPENGVLKEQIFEGLRPILEEWSGVRRTTENEKRRESLIGFGLGCYRDL